MVGRPQDADNENAYKFLPAIQQFLLQGNNKEAQALLQKNFVAKGKCSGFGRCANWGSTLTGGAWICEHIWEHYRFTRDTAFLKEYYPVLKGAAKFLQSILIKEPVHGWYVAAPSNSPENTYIMPDGFQGQTCMGPTIDMQICRELFHACINSANILKMDHEWTGELTALIPPPQQKSPG